MLIRMLADVKQATIAPLIRATIAEGSMVYTDEYDIDSRLKEWGHAHETVCHTKGEYARDDGAGFCVVHVNTLEGFWSLLHSWLRPHLGISQEELPLYFAFFELIHNVRARGKSVLGSHIGLLLSPPRNPALAFSLTRMNVMNFQPLVESTELDLKPALRSSEPINQIVFYFKPLVLTVQSFVSCRRMETEELVKKRLPSGENAKLNSP